METAPVLLICFDRPQNASLVLDTISVWDCPLFLFRDGGGNPADEAAFLDLFQKVKAGRQQPTHINILQKNLGGRDGPWHAINWFFTQVEAGIVLEEDILPHPAMAEIHTNALKAFEKNPTIFALGGAPNFDVPAPGPNPWTPHPLFQVWGWSSWANRILGVRVPNDIWHTDGAQVLQAFTSLSARMYLHREMKMLEANPNMCWSYYLQLHLLAHNQRVLIPETKLVQNTGISPTARRTKYCKDARVNPDACLAMREKPPEANLAKPRWAKTVERAKFGGFIHEIRNRLKLRQRFREIFAP